MAAANSQDNGLGDQSIPQWKRELIMRRRAISRTLAVGNTSVQLTCPATVAGVKPAEQVSLEDVASKYQRCISSPITSNKGAPPDQPQTDFHSTERLASSSLASVDSVSVVNNMRLLEHHGSACNDSLLNGINVDISNSGDPISVSYRKMGEEKSNKMSASKSVVDNCVVLGENNNCAVFRDETLDSDSSEELQYGPGIVKILKDKYMSMTLRDSQNITKSNIAHMRRATSLEHLVDTNTLETGKPQIKAGNRFAKRTDVVKSSNKSQQSSQQHQRYRNQNRGNESMKRARSVETLLRYDLKSSGAGVVGGLLVYDHNKLRSKETKHKVSHVSIPKSKVLLKDDIVIVENKSKVESTMAVTEDRTSTAKLIGAQRVRSISGTSEGELPPPDVVKQTLKIFENRPSTGKPSVSGTNKTPSSISGKVNINANVNKPLVLPKPSSEKVHHGVPNRKVSPKQLQRFPSLEKQPVPSSLPNRIPSPPISPSRFKSPSPTSESPKTLLVSKDIESRSLSPVPTNTVLHNGRVDSPVASINVNENEDSESPVKHVSSSALEGIRKCGTTEVYQFSTVNAEVEKNKTHLPGFPIVSPRILKSPSPVQDSSPTCRVPNLKSPDSPQHHKQIGIIKPMTHNKTTSSSSPTLTHRVREKNHINREKSSEAEVNLKKTEELGVNSEKTLVEECVNEPIFQTLILKETKSQGLWDKKSHQSNQQCFNFVNSNTSIPDYIPNDGLIYTKPVKSKAGDAGVVRIAGAIGDESSTDVDVDGYLGPPSPCNVEFEGANVLINGRSNLRKDASRRKLHISFDDAATSTFEYPSEASLLEETVPQPAGATSPIGGSSLASYTPSKVLLGNEGFQLGVTRAISSPPPPLKLDVASDVEEGDYLKPAEDGEVVTWSAEKTTDLLF